MALVALSLVNYRTSAFADMARDHRAAHEVGAIVLWDLSHAVGAVPIDLDGAGADLAVGCTYKYLNAGPGAPAFLYVRRELQGTLRNPIQGWFGQHDMFAMGQGYDPEPGIARLAGGHAQAYSLWPPSRRASDSPPRRAWTAIRIKVDRPDGVRRGAAHERLAPLGCALGSPREAPGAARTSRCAGRCREVVRPPHGRRRRH